MSLNIKNEEAVRLAREVASRTGESLTDAIRVSLLERLERLSRGDDAIRLERLRAMSRDIAAQLGPYDGGITTDDLYDDETGLPA